MTGTRIEAIELLCPDPAATAGFYERAFGCRAADEPGAILLGPQRLVLARASASGPPSAPSNAGAFQHCAIIVSDMAAAMAHLASVAGWTAISLCGPERLPGASGAATAFKFRDPDGHPLELLEFPAGRVPAAWQRSGGPFLGIDHSAISVVDTDRAAAFWAGLGFRAAERHMNRGPEQARLDGLAGFEEVEVEVTTLVPAGGAPPHLELLAYRHPAPMAGTAPEGSPLASTLLLRGAPRAEGRADDPDGHRLRILPP